MTEPLTPEAAIILERLQREVQRAEPQVGPRNFNPEPAVTPESTVDNLAPLLAEVETALTGHRQVGQINPRPPGFPNAVIQFVKKVMRRSLTWYTRPIHVFQGAVIRALQQIVLLLQAQQDASGTLARKLNDLSHRVTQEADSLSQQLVLANQTNFDSRQQSARQIVDLKTDVMRQISGSHGELSTNLVRVKTDILQQLSTTRGELSGQIDAVRISALQDLQQIRDLVDILRSQLSSETNELIAINRRQRARERDVRRFVDAVETGAVTLPSRPGPPTPPMFASQIKRQGEFDYFMFEDCYRGSEEAIRARQQEYLKYFLDRENIVDIGCGRGEFLELLKDNGITARGVELGTDQFLLCREKGLDVEQQDLFGFLESLPDESVGGLFSAQVIEHLTASDQLRYIRLAYNKCKPGSPVIFETINAQCVYAVVRNFFLDPTHVRPVHPETLKFAMESVNFRDVQLQFMSPVVEKHIPPLHIDNKPEEVERFNLAIRHLNDLIYGSQDYAAIGWR